MKFIKLGSKPDAFQADGKNNRYVSSEMATDLIINVGEVKFYLHKFPLLSKSNRLQKLVSKANEENSDEIHLINFPGGHKAFEICTKFCYGMAITLNAYTVVAARCAAQYLEMTDDIDNQNLIFKLEVFLNSSIFRSWKDSIIALQTTKSLLPWSEDLNIVGRCIDSIASKTSVDPENINWSYTYNRKLSGKNDRCVPKDWWVEDVCELEIEHFKRVIVAVKSKGRMYGVIIGESLRIYATKQLPDSIDYLYTSDAHITRNKDLVETIICLLPSDTNTAGCSCSFLLKLLKFAILVKADKLSREDLVKRISLKLHDASAKDLLIPVESSHITRYDVELVQRILHRYLMRENSNETLNKNEKVRSLLSVGKLIDEYLAEIAHDPNLSLSSFLDLSRSIPESARPVHDGLYKAIDIYLKEYPSLTKVQRKKICALMDIKKLTIEASTHAAQNDRLPLRVVVQVLFFEQVRASSRAQAISNNAHDSSHLTTNSNNLNDKMSLERCKSLKQQTSGVDIDDFDCKKVDKLDKVKSEDSGNVVQLLRSRSRRIIDKLWVMSKGHGENRSPETSGNSLSCSRSTRNSISSTRLSTKIE